jgi:hypothetical protein
MTDMFIREVDGRTFELVESPYGYTFDVFETTGGKQVRLTRDVDLPDIETLTDEVLLALTEPRRIGLADGYWRATGSGSTTATGPRSSALRASN